MNTTNTPGPRDRSKLNQRKYRAMVKQSNAQLAKDTMALDMNNVRLEARLGVLRELAGVSDCIAAVKAYMHAFEHGVASPAHRNDADKCVALLQQQESSIRALFAPHVAFDGKAKWNDHIGQWMATQMVGVDELVERWTTCRLLFDTVGCVECSEVDVLAVTTDVFVLQTTTVKHILVTDTTVRLLFPHLNRQVAHKLIESSGLRVPTQVVFTFDSKSLRVTRVDVSSNVVAALVENLKSAEWACHALDGAQLDQHDVVFHP